MTTARRASGEPRSLTVLSVQSPSRSAATANTPSLIVFQERKRKLVYKDSSLCLEITQRSHGRSTSRTRKGEPTFITVYESREIQHHKTRSYPTVPRTRCLGHSRSGSQQSLSTTQNIKKTFDSAVKQFAAESSRFRKIVHLKTDTHHFFGIPRFRRKIKSETHPLLNMSDSSETSQRETSTTETTPTAGDSPTEPVVVRVKSDHAGKAKATPQNGEAKKQDGCLKVPDSSEKKRRSMETLTAKMDFEDEDDN